MTTTSRDVELVVKAKNLAAQPLAEVAAAVESLVAKMEDITPAAQRGEGSIEELRSIAGQLEKALKALGGDRALLESFTTLQTQIAEQEKALAALQQRVEAAKAAYSGVEKPTRDMAKEVAASAKAFESQQKALNSSVASLNKLIETAGKAGINFDQFAQAEATIEGALQRAIPAYNSVNKEIGEFATNQRRAAEAAQAAQEALQATQRTQAAQAQAERQAAAQAAEAAVQKEREIALALKAYEAEEREIAQIQREAAARREAEAALDARLRRKAQEAQMEVLWQRLLSDRDAKERRAAAAEAEWAAMAERSARAMREGTVIETQATAAKRQLVQAIREGVTETAREAAARGKLVAGFKLLQDEGRATFSLYQRLRGELLSLAATYVGLYGAIRSVGTILDAVNKRTAVENTFAVAFGKENVGAEMEYVQAQAERLGIRFLDLAESYGKFAVAARATGMTVRDTRFIFESFSEATRVLHLSTEQTNYVFLALQQMMSKGKVNMQDLRQQLGDHLPGAVAIFAKALGVSSAECEKMIESGKLSSQTLVAFAQEVRDRFGKELTNSLHTPQAEIARFESQIDKLKLAIADGGLLERFTVAVKKLTDYLNSTNGKKFADGLTKAFNSVANAVIWLLDHLGLVKAILEILAAGIAVKWLTGLRRDLLQVLPVFGQMRNGLQTVRTLIGLAFAEAPLLTKALGGMFGVLAAGMAGFQIGTWLRENFAGVRAFGDYLIGIFMALKAGIITIFKDMWAHAFNPLQWGEAAKKGREAFLAEWAKARDAAASEFSDDKDFTPKFQTTTTTADATELARIQAEAQTTAAESGANKEREIINRLHELRAQTMKKDAEDQASYVAALREQYQPLFDQIAEFGKTSAAKARQFAAELNAIIATMGQQKGEEFQVNEGERREQEINGLIEERNHLIANENKLKDAGAQSDAKTTANIATFNNQYNALIRPKIEAFQQFVQSLPAGVAAKFKLVMSDMAVHLQTLSDRPLVNPIKDAKEAEERLNGLFSERTAALQAQRELLEAQGKTTREIRVELAKTGNSYRDEIMPQLDALLDKLQNSKDLTDDQRKSLVGVIQHLQTMKIRLGEDITPRMLPIDEIIRQWAEGLTGVVEGFVRAAVASGKLTGGINGALKAFRQFASDFLLKIAQMILRTQILNALQSASKGGGWVGTAANWLSTLAGVHHRGGLAGAAGASRTVSALAFVGAARFHSGGLPGLRPDEVPIIAQRGEEILSRSDPRNALNGGGAASSPMSIKVINTVDSESVVQHGLATPSGERAIMNIIRANRSSIKQALA